MSQSTNVVWNTANVLWNANPYVWNLLALIMSFGGPAEMTQLQRNQFRNLKQSTKNRLIQIYVETFKDYMDDESRRLAERAGVRLRHTEEKPLLENVEVTAEEKSATAIVEVAFRSAPEITTRPRITLTALFEILDIY
jgi:hypothetical protein